MPELAEVEFFRKEWNPGLDHVVTAVFLHERSRLFRRSDPAALKQHLVESRLLASEAHGKRLLFHFGDAGKGAKSWLGLHLGMTGNLRSEAAGYRAGKHDHLVLYQDVRALVFADARQFGRVDFATGEATPSWWQELPPPVLSPEFTRQRMEQFIERHRRSPIKAVLLMQDGFPGLGNWMVDEILWKAKIAPARPAGTLLVPERKRLYRAIRRVCRIAMQTTGVDFRDPPADWLFHQRWKKGGTCPRTGDPLRYDQIGGRTTCWSPGVQRVRPEV